MVNYMMDGDFPVIRKLKDFFNKDSSKYLSLGETRAFWVSLTESEKHYFRKCVYFQEI